MKHGKSISAAVTVLLLALSLIGCGGGSGSASNNIGGGSKPLDPQGNWLFTFQNTTGSFLAGGQLFELNPPAITSNGMPFGPNPYAGQSCEGSLQFSGSVSGTATVNFTASQVSTSNNTPNPLKLSLTGTIATDQAHMSGTYTLSQGACGDPQTDAQSGTWSAQLLAPATGTWSGTLSSTSALNVSLSATLSEDTSQTSVNMGQVSGTVTVTNSTCSQGGALAAQPNVHLGEQVQLTTAPDSNGVSLSVTGLENPGGTQISGVTVTVHGGSCDGQTYTGALAP